MALPTDPTLPLADLKVLDFSWAGVGPITVKYLADHGATVLRVESHARYDVVRLGPPWHDGKPGIERSQFYASYNTSKLGIALDLSKPEARAIARRLAAWADVVVESYTPRVMRAFGLAYEDLRAVNPHLVMLSTCLQGQTGPYAEFPGFGQLAAALSGFYGIAGRVATRAGNRSDHAAPHGAYPCAGDDRWIALSVRGEAEWRALCAVLAQPAWLADARFSTHAARVAHAEALDALVAAATRSLDASELVGRLQAAGIAAGVVQSALDLHADPVLAGWGFFQWLRDPARPPGASRGPALGLEATPGKLRWAAPALGEHTALVLREVLGMTEEEIARLIDERVAW